MDNKPNCTFVGRVVSVGETQTLGKNPAKPFYKREIVVDDAEPGAKYPNEVAFESTGDKCKFLDQYKPGDYVEIDFFPNGRAWTDPKTQAVRHFISLRIGFIKKLTQGGEATDTFAEAEGQPGDGTDDYDDVADDMPF